MESKFSFNIRVIDDTGIWQAIWNNLKDQLNLHFIPLSYKENNNTKSLGNLNLKLISNADDCNNTSFTIYIFKLNSISDLKGNVKENILKNIQSEKDIFPVVLMDIDNTDSALKSSLKVFEKIKSELKLNILKLLPINPQNIKLSDIINDFFRELKNRISFEMSKKFFTFSSNIDNLKLIKLENKENTYCYISNKDSLIECLEAAEFFGEIIKICESDINTEFKHLEKFSPKFENKNNFNDSFYYESFSLIDFNDLLIKKKIENKTLTNLDYQIYLFNIIIRNFKISREFKKLYNFVLKFLNNISNLKALFPSTYYFNFWCINFIAKILPFYKTMKGNYLNSYEEDMNYKAQNEILYLQKKHLKSFAKLLNYEIPNAKIFKILTTNNISEININNNTRNLINKGEESERIDEKNNKELNELSLSFESQLEKKVKTYIQNRINMLSSKNKEENFQNFIKDVNINLDEKNKFFILSREKFLEEYLNIINNTEKTHQNLNEQRLLFRLQLEKLPILFSQGKFSEMKIILMENLQKIKKQKDKEESLKIKQQPNQSKDESNKTFQNLNELSKGKHDSSQGFLKRQEILFWPLLKEYVCSLLILLLNSLDKSTENIRIIIDVLNVYQSNEIISSYLDLPNKNTIKEILTKYLDDNIILNHHRNSSSNNSYSAFSQNGEKEIASNLLKVNLNEIIDFEYSISDKENKVGGENHFINLDSKFCKNNIFFYNKEKTKNINFDFHLNNKSDLEMKITSLTIEFFDELNSQKIKYDYIPLLNNDSLENENNDINNIFFVKGSDKTSFKFELDINSLDKVKNLNIASLVINKVYFYLTWGILGIFKFKVNDSIIYIKNNDFELSTSMTNFSEIKKDLVSKTSFFNKKNNSNNRDKTDLEKIDTLFFNIENPLIINFSKMKEFDFEKYYIDVDLKLSNSHLIKDQNDADDLNQRKSSSNNLKPLNENNKLKCYNIDNGNLKLELLNEVEMIKFTENIYSSLNDEQQNFSIPSYIISQSTNEESYNEQLLEKVNIDIENLKSEFSCFKKEKNLKIFDKAFFENIKKTIKPINEEDLFNKYILQNQKIFNSNNFENQKNDISCIKLPLSPSKSSFISHNEDKFFIILKIIFSNSDFNCMFKQKLQIRIDIRENSTHKSIFQTREEYEFELKHLFSFITKSTLRNVKLRNINLNMQIFKHENNNSENHSKIDFSRDNISNSSFKKEKTVLSLKESLFILLQNSVSLNLDYNNILLKLNKKFNFIKKNQLFELINKIPFYFKDETENELLLEDTNPKNCFSFKELFFKFTFNKTESNSEEKKNKRISMDTFINNDNISNFSNENGVLNKIDSNKNKIFENIDINEYIKFDEDERSIMLKNHRFFYPIDSIIDKLDAFSQVEYLVKLNFLDKSQMKTDNSIKSLLHDSSQTRKSIAFTFLNTPENYLGLENSNSNKNNQILNLNNIVNRKDSKRINANANFSQINSCLFENNEKNYFEIYKEILLILNITKLNKNKTFFMIKVKEDYNWTIVGKTRIIEKFNQEEREKNIILKLIPLQDGYIRLPELELSDYHEYEEIDIDRKESVNHMEFVELNYSSVWIEGNQKIIKVNPVNQTSLKVNVI